MELTRYGLWPCFFFLAGEKKSARARGPQVRPVWVSGGGGGGPRQRPSGVAHISHGQPSVRLFGHASEGQSSVATLLASGCAAPHLAAPFRPLWLH